MKEIAPGVACLPTSIVNVYLVGAPGGPWILVDAGMPGHAEQILAAAQMRYGNLHPPAAIVLTHGHFDHVGCALELANAWDVPIYAHRLEMPYLTGRSKYPPFDPTVGGFFPFFSRFFPESSPDLRPRLKALPPDGRLPAMEGWEWYLTPGHAPGHISLFRASDRTLIAGDAFITLNMDSCLDTLTKRQEIARPPAYATCDWDSARRSVRQLAGLRPFTAATGHGIPMAGAAVADRLQSLAEHFPVPSHGRYVPEPARTDESGIVSLPPPVPDPLPGRLAAGLGAAALAGTVLAVAAGRRRRNRGENQ